MTPVNKRWPPDLTFVRGLLSAGTAWADLGVWLHQDDQELRGTIRLVADEIRREREIAETPTQEMTKP